VTAVTARELSIPGETCESVVVYKADGYAKRFSFTVQFGMRSLEIFPGLEEMNSPLTHGHTTRSLGLALLSLEGFHVLRQIGDPKPNQVFVY